MPELPEVETIVRELATFLRGRRIVQARVMCARISRGSGAEIEKALAGASIEAVERHGKHIVLTLDHGRLLIHLGMTGKLLFDVDDQFVRASFVLDDGRTLLFSDVRRFGRVEWSAELPERVARLGPDAATVGEAEFMERLAGRTTKIKNLLLDQNVLRGMGNIYTDEALFRAGIHPLTPANRLSRNRLRRLHGVVRDLLAEAIEHRGSSISDYVDASGARGSFQDRHRVYGRAGQPCLECRTPVERIVVAQRGTHFCPRCQKEIVIKG